MCLRWRQLSKYPGNKSIRIQRFPVACDPPEASASTSLRGEVRKVTVGECCLVGFDNAGGSGSSLWGVGYTMCRLNWLPQLHGSRRPLRAGARGESGPEHCDVQSEAQLPVRSAQSRKNRVPSQWKLGAKRGMRLF